MPGRGESGVGVGVEALQQSLGEDVGGVHATGAGLVGEAGEVAAGVAMRGALAYAADATLKLHERASRPHVHRFSPSASW